MLISKIISGGQTGVDRGAIEAALELGFPYGELIPKGRLAEDGAVPAKFDRMEVAPKKSACLLLGEPRAEMRGDAGQFGVEAGFVVLGDGHFLRFFVEKDCAATGRAVV